MWRAEAALNRAIETALVYLGVSAVGTRGHATAAATATEHKPIEVGRARFAGGRSRPVSGAGGGDTTRPTGPPSGIDLTPGSLAVWLHFVSTSTDVLGPASDRRKQRSANLPSRGHGPFAAFHNGVHLGTTAEAVTDDQRHSQVFTWRDGEKKGPSLEESSQDRPTPRPARTIRSYSPLTCQRSGTESSAGAC